MFDKVCQTSVLSVIKMHGWYMGVENLLSAVKKKKQCLTAQMNLYRFLIVTRSVSDLAANRNKLIVAQKIILTKNLFI